MTDERHLVAAFMLDANPTETESTETLLTAAGATSIGPLFDSPGVVHCSWAGWPCRARMETVGPLRVLMVHFLEMDFYRVDVEDDSGPEAHPLVLAFARACDGLLPVAAVIVTRTWQATPEYVADLAMAAADRNVYALCTARTGALYLPRDEEDELFADLTRGRDRWRTASGVIVFASAGASRWQ
jgi:hypothetical protein